MKSCRVVFPQEMQVDLRSTASMWVIQFGVAVIIPDTHGNLIEVSGVFHSNFPHSFLKIIEKLEEKGIKIIEIE